MLKQVKLSNFKVVPKEKPGKLPDHGLIIHFMPKTPEDLDFRKIDMDIKGVYMNGIVDYSINDKDFDCTVLYDDNVPHNRRDAIRYFMYFTPKMKKDGGMDSDTVEPAKPAQFVDGSNVRTDYKSIRSYPESKSVILVSDQAIVLRSASASEEGTMLSVGPSQISIFGKMVEYDFPTRNNMVLQESGMMTMLPKAFIPPFCMPDHLPDPTMVVKTVEALSVVRNLKKLLG